MTLPARLSVLDRSLVRAGGDGPGALRATVRFARSVEALGYRRFWVAEHHGVPGVAGSAPTVLAAAVAASTTRIRVGTGGVMLPNHQPLVVAEQFGVLESLFPGRIDMGLGRSVGFTSGVRRALGRDKAAAEGFPGQVTELLGYFTGPSPVGVRANPGEGLRVSPFVLATGAGADTAADLGLPLVIPGSREAEIERYRERFRPSPWSATPYVVVAVAVSVADTTAAARRLLVSEAWSTAYSQTHGVFPPLVHPNEVLGIDMTARERELFERAMSGQIHGTAPEVASELEKLTHRTGADEIMITTSGFDRDEVLDSYRRLAGLMITLP
ncbi:MsnO8 family LLM class oxidoreductase [Allokutzneria sp. A3M-2-11 16]|uniref:MsnO8 family LLM class oxidoreductase n=1 Tax=Allokutzneria sp. A3M-2-11 16 TaxID=2962043 RepID=UPI0020B7C7A6|nr:MsnO8 family LLM class oxidoreductase [Allokutzneria sp. A3M-2-11 16]MCP3803214.1 MsnO8 family LLM class oxidoreductase [Allokutzneria sp. A3M-2-11 16]